MLRTMTILALSVPLLILVGLGLFQLQTALADHVVVIAIH